jgi:DNA-binding response OmpR family regulator
MIVRSLVDGGYCVLDACDGDQALALLASDAKIDLVIADIVMPNVGGLQLFKRLTFADRAPLFLFISGYRQDPSQIPGPLLEKPFGPETLVAEVRRLLSEASPPTKPKICYAQTLTPPPKTGRILRQLVTAEYHLQIHATASRCS